MPHSKKSPSSARPSQPTRPVSIVGTGSYLPARIMPNSELEKMVETTDEWIVTRTGIRERRIAAPDEFTSDMAARAALRALEEARISPEEVDLIIVGTATPDHPFPSTACLVQNKIGAKRAACFDMEAACAGFLFAMEIGANFIASGAYNTVLAIGAEKLTSILNWKDRSTCVLFGDGAGAAVLRAGGDGHEIWATHLGSDGSLADLICMPGGGSALPATSATVADNKHYLTMQGPEVFKQAVISMARSSHEVLKRCHMTAHDVNWIIPHQANIRIMLSLADRLDIPRDRCYVTVDKYGNTSAASVIVALDEASKKGALKKGDLILMTVFGSGLTVASSVVKW
jgi:3-oxoacyl-[acyl-carrier-protein] synthase-3